MRVNDTLCGLIIIILALVMIALTTTFPAFPGQNYGPSLFPRILGSGLIICGGLLIINNIRSRPAGSSWVEIAPWVREPWRLTAFFLVLGLLLLYILVSESVGFIPMSFAFLMALFLWFGVRVINAIVIALISTLVVHWFFASLLRVPLPRGWLDFIL